LVDDQQRATNVRWWNLLRLAPGGKTQNWKSNLLDRRWFLLRILSGWVCARLYHAPKPAMWKDLLLLHGESLLSWWVVEWGATGGWIDGIPLYPY
jgi:hypothetical protein